MAVKTAKDITLVEIPDNLADSLVVRCISDDFGESKSSGVAMITSRWEIVGIYDKETKQVKDHMIVGGKKYVIGGLETRPVYHSLSDKALPRHMDFWSKATGKPKDDYEIDTENPDRSYYKGLVMSAVVKAELTPRTKPLTDEQKEELRAAGKPLVGEPMVDDEGNPLPPYKSASIDTFNRRFNGELPQF